MSIRIGLASVLSLSLWNYSSVNAQSTCNLAAIRAAFTGAGCVELANCQDACSLYFILPSQMSGNAAQAFAQNLGANLISVESGAENSCIANNLNALGYGGPIWIGFNDIASEGSFVWFDQATIVYTNWAGGEPNNSGNEDCTQIYPNGFWNDLDCNSGNSKSVIEVNLCPQITIIPNPASATVCLGQGVTLSANTILGSRPYTYSWSPAAGLSSTVLQAPVASPTVTSNYTVTVTDRYSCSATQNRTVTINAPNANAGPDQTTCAGTPVTFAASGGVSYSWSPPTGLNNAAISNPTATLFGTTPYTLTVTDVNGCSNTDNILVNVNQLPLANAGNDVAICAGGTTSLGASGGITYVWSPGTALSNVNASNPAANPATNTVYTVTVTDANSCVNTDAVTVTVNPLPTPNAGIDQAICNGSSANLSVTGGISYVWSPATGLDNPNSATPIANPAATTTYTVTATDANNCTATDVIDIVVNPLPVADAGPDVAICIGLNTTLQASGGVSYVWSPATGLSATNINNPVANPLTTTTYTVTTTDANGCIDTDDVTVTVNPLPPANAGLDEAICVNNSINLLASGGIEYLWSPVLGISVVNIANPVANPLTTTLYTVTVRDGNGCINTDDINVTVNPLPTPNAGADVAICIGASTNLSANGGLTYFWSPAASLDNSALQAPIATPVATTTYTVTATDANGCSANDEVIVTVNPLPNANAGPDAPICLGLSTNLQATGGVTYSWSPALGLSVVNISNPVANPAVTTLYTVTVTDLNGCVSTDDINVTVNLLPIADAGTDAAICIGSSTQFAASGGIQYSWSPTLGLSNANAANPSANPITTTLYTVSVTDANSCVSSDDITVTVNPLPTPNAGLDQAICIGASANLSASGGLTYTWLPVGSLDNAAVDNPVATPVSTTTYIVTATDVNNCTATDNIIITVNPLPNANAGVDSEICEGLSTNLLATGGTAYDWSPGLGLSSTNIDNPVANPIVTTTYTVTVTDINQCVNTDDVTVTVNPLPPASAGNDVAICSGSSTILSASGGITYAWNPVQDLSASSLQSPTANPTTTVIYTVTVTDANGCQLTDDVEVTVNPLPIVDAGLPLTICYHETATLQGAGNGNQFAWTPVTDLTDPTIPSPDANPRTTINYTLTVTDANNCVNTDDVLVTVNPTPYVVFSAEEVCLNVPTEFFHQCSISSGSLANFSWDFGEPPATETNPNPTYSYLTANTFQVNLSVTSDLGCEHDTTLPVTVNPLPVVSFSAVPAEGCVPLSVDFTNTTTISTGNILNYSWDFGNGNTSTQFEPQTTYVNPTTYGVSLTAVSDKVCSTTLFIPDYITTNPKPEAEFSHQPNPADILMESIVNFTDLSIGNPVSWLWDLGDGSESTLQNPEHEYTDTGKFEVNLFIQNQFGCEDTIKRIIKVNPSYAFFIPSAFTPGNDGFNELYMAKGIGIKDFEIVILDRWGSEVFHSKNLYEGWNGTMKDTGNEVKQGVYTFQINIHDYHNRPKYYRGTVTLIR